MMNWFPLNTSWDTLFLTVRQRISDTVSYPTLKKLPHEVPALSLDKTKDREALATWLNGRTGVLSWKMDGLTVVVTYLGGKLVRAVTRGNGVVGEDITHNAPVIHGMPMIIPEKGKSLSAEKL